jgi:hypothetical protein
MERRALLRGGCTCAAASLAGVWLPMREDESPTSDADGRKNALQNINPDQVRNVLKFIDSSQEEFVKESIFGRLGVECFTSRKLDEWVAPYRGNVQAFLDRVNIEKKSKYWERLEFNADKTVLLLTGRKVQGCVCGFADCEKPPLSLCLHCCRNFQQELFGSLLDRKVRVKITESFLLGHERCNTRICLV